MSVQGVLNTRLSEKIGLYEANVIVQGTAFALSAVAVLFFGRGYFREMADVPRYCWLGGVLGLIITVTVMLGIKDLNPTVSISTILIAQLAVAALIDAFGLFGSEKIAFGWSKYVGIAVMIAGVVIFKLKI